MICNAKLGFLKGHYVKGTLTFAHQTTRQN